MTIGMTIRRTGALLATSALLAGSAMTMAPAAQAADNGAWSATPCQKGQFTPRQFFFFEAADGQTLEDCVTITNASEDPLTLDLYPADAFNVDAGAGFALRERGQENTDVGAWIQIDEEQVRIPAGDSVDVDFTMRVPEGITPGDHAGGVVTIEPAPTTDASGGSSQIAVQRALGVRAYVRIAGPLTPTLTIDEVQLDIRPARLPFIGNQGLAVVTYRVTNNGNVRLAPARDIKLTGVNGRTVAQSPEGGLPEILPGSTVTLTEQFEGMPVLDRVTASVELTDARAEVSATGSTKAWSVSWIFVAVLVVLVGSAWYYIRRLRETRSEDAQAEDTDDRSAAEALPS